MMSSDENEETPRGATPAPAPVPAVATNLSLQPPAKFDFRHPDEWPKWKRWFKQYLAATGLDRGDSARTVSTLLYTMGDDADDVLTSTDITDAERGDYTVVLEKFDAFFKVRRNLIFERAKFNRRDQAEGESAEQYITCLYHLVENCDYGQFKEELLRDRIVVGIRDKALSEKLQMDANLTLEKAKTQIRQKEAVRQQRQELQGKKPSNVDSTRAKRNRQANNKGGASGSHKPNQPCKPCMRCGKPRHPTPDKCPALSVTCHKCQRKGHYASQCLSKTVAPSPAATPAAAQEVEVELSDSEEDTFLGAVNSDRGTVWRTNVKLQGREIVFKMDTGAEVTVISDSVYHTLNNVRLEESSRSLYGPAHQSLEVMGQFNGKLKRGKRSHSEKIYVVKDLHNNLLGLPAITALRLIKRVDATASEKSDTDL